MYKIKIDYFINDSEEYVANIECFKSDYGENTDIFLVKDKLHNKGFFPIRSNSSSNFDELKEWVGQVIGNADKLIRRRRKRFIKTETIEI